MRDFSLIKEMIKGSAGMACIDMVGVSTTIPKDVIPFQQVEAQLLVLDCREQRIEAFRLAQQIEDDEAYDLKVLFLFERLDAEIIHFLLGKKKKCYLIEPYTIADILRMICIEEGELDEQNNATDFDRLTKLVLSDLALPNHLTGYNYIKSAAILQYQISISDHRPIKYIYNEIAHMYNTTASRVEKSIRTSSSYAFRKDPQLISFRGRKPTNSELIYEICERMKLYDRGSL